MGLTEGYLDEEESSLTLFLLEKILEFSILQVGINLGNIQKGKALVTNIIKI